MSQIVLNDRRTINGWAFFDWANSAYALVITAAIFPAYFVQITDDIINVAGFRITNSGLYAFCVTASYIVILLLTPLLSGIADYTGRRKFFLRFFTLLGSIACMSLFFFKGMSTIWVGVIGFILATIGFSGGLVFYNAYLPEIASEDQFDRVSAKGFAYGYIGSVLLLIVNLLIIKNPELIHLDHFIGEGNTWFFGTDPTVLATCLAFLMVGMWWIGFAQITFRRMPDDDMKILESDFVAKGIDELKSVWQKIKVQKNVKRFLLAYFFYSAGVNTIIYLAATFAEKELHFATTDLILLILILQIVAIGGAYLFAFISKVRGNKFSLISMLIIWILICIASYFVFTQLWFYIIAGFVGMVMGGIQALSRSTYSKLIESDAGDLTSYFSFYDVLQKLAIVVGTFSFGLVEQLVGGMRQSILVLGIYFLLGLLVLLTVRLHPPKKSALHRQN